VKIDCGVIAVVEDDAGFRTFLEELLEPEGRRIVSFGSGEGFVGALAAEAPALVLLDIHLGGISGYEVLHAVRARFGDQVPIVFISGARTEPHDRAAGLMIGADDYVVKPVAADELLARVRRLLRRSAPRPLPRRLDESEPNLTTREREVLGLLASGKSQKQISAQLFISPNTVATHIQRILSKLGVHSRTEAVAMAYRLGLVGVLPPGNLAERSAGRAG
jgi:two-component system nitrate/nitrite response regulator NarL